MKKGIFLLALITGAAAFSNCDAKAEKLLNTVIKDKLIVSKNDNLKYYSPEKDGPGYYKYQIFYQDKFGYHYLIYLIINLTNKMNYDY